MEKKDHLTLDGFYKIIRIKAAMNLGLSESFKSEFKDQALLVSVKRPKNQNDLIPAPYWIAGFVDGEGTFDIKISSSKTNVGFAVQLRFRIPQHERDSKLIELLMKYFRSGSIEKHTKHPAVTLVINKFITITAQIIPFFESYPLNGVKKMIF